MLNNKLNIFLGSFGIGAWLDKDQIQQQNCMEVIDNYLAKLELGHTPLNI